MNPIDLKFSTNISWVIDLCLITGLVGRGVVGLGLVIVGLCVTIVGDISDVTGITIDVIIDILTATVGEDDVVVAGGFVTIASFVLGHVNVVVVVLDGPVEFVVSRGLWGISAIHFNFSEKKN